MLKDFTKEKFDIFILAGQSNAEGYGLGPVEEPYVTTDKVWYLNNDFTISLAREYVGHNETQSNFGLNFSKEYIDKGLLKEDRKILIIRAAVGGTAFLENHWKIGDEIYERMLDMIETALSLNSENKLCCLLWHQGETDAWNKASFKVHYNHLMTLIKSVREKYNEPKLPFIAGDFVHHWKNENIEKATPVVEAIKSVCEDCKFGAFVESDGLLSNYQELGRKTYGWDNIDNIHFSRKSIYELASRYFKAYLNIIGK